MQKHSWQLLAAAAAVSSRWWQQGYTQHQHLACEDCIGAAAHLVYVHGVTSFLQHKASSGHLHLVQGASQAQLPLLEHL
jgi:hypothetical protein